MDNDAAFWRQSIGNIDLCIRVDLSLCHTIGKIRNTLRRIVSNDLPVHGMSFHLDRDDSYRFIFGNRDSESVPDCTSDDLMDSAELWNLCEEEVYASLLVSEHVQVLTSKGAVLEESLTMEGLVTNILDVKTLPAAMALWLEYAAPNGTEIGDALSMLDDQLSRTEPERAHRRPYYLETAGVIIRMANDEAGKSPYFDSLQAQVREYELSSIAPAVSPICQPKARL